MGLVCLDNRDPRRTPNFLEWRHTARGPARPTFGLFLIAPLAKFLAVRLSRSLPGDGNASLTNGFGPKEQPVVYPKTIRPTLWGWDELYGGMAERLIAGDL